MHRLPSLPPGRTPLPFPEGEIPTIQPPGFPFDAVLANALYFKGLWTHQFDKRLVV